MQAVEAGLDIRIILELEGVKTAASKVVELIADKVARCPKFTGVSALPQLPRTGKTPAVGKGGEVHGYQFQPCENPLYRGGRLVGFQYHAYRTFGGSAKRIELIQREQLAMPVVFHNPTVLNDSGHTRLP
jgi:hypothetical protein